MCEGTAYCSEEYVYGMKSETTFTLIVTIVSDSSSEGRNSILDLHWRKQELRMENEHRSIYSLECCSQIGDQIVELNIHPC